MMQANPFLILIVIWIGLLASGHASVRDVSESSSPVSSSSSKQLNTSGSISTHPNHVTYPQSTRKAKVDDDDDVGTEDMGSQWSGSNDNSNSSKNSSSLNPIAKAATDTSSSPAFLPSSSSSNNTSKQYCDRPRRPNSGVLLKPWRKTYDVGNTVVFQCHNGVTATAHCEEGGQWSRGSPHCPSTNQSCPPHVFANGNVTYTPSTAQNPRPLRSKAHFRCNDGYELVGAPVVVCDKEFQWSYKTPACLPIVSETGSSSGSLLTGLLLSIAILFSLVVVISGSLWYRWRRRKAQRDQWKRLFVNYTYRQSKRKITRDVHNNANATHQEMKQFQAAAAVIPSTEL